MLLALFETVLSSTTISPEEPRVVVALDNSESMTLGGIDTTRIAEAKRVAQMLFDSELDNGILPASFADSIWTFLPPSLDSIASASRP